MWWHVGAIPRVTDWQITKNVAIKNLLSVNSSISIPPYGGYKLVMIHLRCLHGKMDSILVNDDLPISLVSR